jgi:hypothetical protein
MFTDGSGRSALGSFSLDGSALIEPVAYQRRSNRATGVAI